ncbi:hypothetical protein N7462_009025 [Penicillium macrosclerotiorum]|uniref:uncharacterized protein n=1 Tax=Penicillium macrosclerotiorum TaxID=303699 RepID=UPI002547B12D|nr:uncharacterized protein N7462_009025 [Penicillium macrosclerotiorum]KAJ5676128.1 hypothetical protein N7462_009025 [Penicillium macrosclerotiorum]
MSTRARGERPYQGRVRGGWRGWRGGRTGRPSAPPTPPPPPPLGDLLATIQDDDLEDDTSESHSLVQITNTQYLTSYNWVSGGHSEIIVPGEPPEWTPLPKAVSLSEDSGVYFRDLNSARHPTYPLEPMIRAILRDRPDFGVKNVDIVGCGSTLGNLLRFARGQSPAFRMLIEVVGNTVFFSRRENSPKETLQGVFGFGHTFPEAYTTWSQGVRKSESHQRLINFEFANLNCVVRFEADGYLPDLLPDDLKTQKGTISSKSVTEPEELLESIQAAMISTIHSGISQQESNALKISTGVAIFHNMGRLWIRQIPNFILAYHKLGKFDDIRVQDVREEMKHWEESEQPSLRKFANLLQMIVSFVRSAEDGKLEIEHGEDEEVLNFRSPGGIVSSVLPLDLEDTWDAHNSSNLES